MIEIFVPSFCFFEFYIFSILCSWIFSFALFFLARKLTQNFYSFDFFLLNLLRLQHRLIKSASPLSLVLVFNLIFFFLLKNIIATTIKTNSVVVDKEGLLYSEDKIRSSKLNPACYVDDSKDIDFLRYSVNGTISHFLYHERTDPNNLCIFFKKNLENDAKFFIVITYYHLFVRIFLKYEIL